MFAKQLKYASVKFCVFVVKTWCVHNSSYSHNPFECVHVHIIALTLFLLGEQEFERFAGTCFSYCC